MKRIILTFTIFLMFIMSACSTNQAVNNETTIDENNTEGIYEENNTESNYDLYAAIKSAKCVTEYLDTATIDDFDTVKFGKYEQDGDESNGAEDIEWMVVEKTNEKALLFSKYVLDYRIYGRNGAWNKSEIRYYLNNDFYKNSFNYDEKQFILDTDLVTNRHTAIDENGKYYNSEMNTRDKIFIFSKDEMLNKFNFKNNIEYGYYSTQVKTTYCKNLVNKRYKFFDYFDGADKITEIKYDDRVIYWLRDYTPADPAWGDNQNDVDDPDHIRTFVFYVEDGGLTSDQHSYRCSWDILGVRPAMWVKYKLY